MSFIRLNGSNNPETTSRIEALSDNIFAVAMTLLILNIKIPSSANPEIAQHLWPHFIALWHHLVMFAVSFLIVGLYWVLHHRVFATIKRSDRALLWINLFFLLFVALIPFSTGLLGEFDENRTAVLIYGVNIMIVGFMLLGIWRYASAHHRLIDLGIDQKLATVVSFQILAMPAMCALAIGVSYLSTTASLGIYLLAPMIYLWPASRRKPKSDRSGESVVRKS